MTRPPRPNGSSRRPSSAPSSSPATSPTGRRRRVGARSVGDAAPQQLERDDRDRLVEDQAIDLREAARVLAATSQACGKPAVGASGAGDRQREPARRQLGMRGHEPARVAAPRTLAELPPSAVTASSVELAPKRAVRLKFAAPVEDERRPPIASAIAPAIASRPRSDSTICWRRSCAAIDRCRQRVLLVDQAPERLLGDRDERHLVGHLEEREAALAGRRSSPSGPSVRESGPEAEPGEPMVGERGDEARAALRGVEHHPGRQQQLATGQPGVGSRARRCGPSAPGCRCGPSPAISVRGRCRRGRRGW